MVEGAPHTAKRSQGSIVVSLGCPLPPYIKEQGGGSRPRGEARHRGGVLLPPGVGLLLSLLAYEKGREKEKEGRGRPPSLVQFGLVHGEGCGNPLGPFSPFPYGPLRPNTNSRNSPVLPKIPESLGTFPMSAYSHPIYRSLRLDHFETPRHVPDLIWDSELLRYIKHINS